MMTSFRRLHVFLLVPGLKLIFRDCIKARSIIDSLTLQNCICDFIVAKHLNISVLERWNSRMGILYTGSHLIFSWQYVRKSFRNALLIKKLNCAFIALCEETIFDLIYGCSDRKERKEEEREELVGGGGWKT